MPVRCAHLVQLSVNVVRLAELLWNDQTFDNLVSVLDYFIDLGFLKTDSELLLLRHCLTLHDHVFEKLLRLVASCILPVFHLVEDLCVILA